MQAASDKSLLLSKKQPTLHEDPEYEDEYKDELFRSLIIISQLR